MLSELGSNHDFFSHEHSKAILLNTSYPFSPVFTETNNGIQVTISVQQFMHHGKT